VEELVRRGVDEDGERLAIGGGQVPELSREAPLDLGREDGAGASAEADDDGRERRCVCQERTSATTFAVAAAFVCHQSIAPAVSMDRFSKDVTCVNMQVGRGTAEPAV
jgi:hypothetical protein